MSYNFNHITLVGRLVRDPELKQIGESNSKCTFVLAVARRMKKEQRETDFIPVMIWGKFGINASRLLKKGMPVLVSGRIQIRTIQLNDEYRSFIDVVADNFQLLSSMTTTDSKKGDQNEIESA
ncbi:single-stranded DNA-binding protein [bacterium]|nr:single-stranded DNA-binding protein [bacterium]